MNAIRRLPLKIHEEFHRILLSALVSVIAACASNPPPPETHHDAFVEYWIGKTKAQAIVKLGKPTQQTSLSSGESTLLWDHPEAHCSQALHTNKDGTIDSGHNSCDTNPSQQPDARQLREVQ
jgi:hypothetical protein